MASTDVVGGSIKWILSVDDGDFNNKLNKASSSAEKTSKKIEEDVTQMSDKAGGAFSNFTSNMISSLDKAADASNIFATGLLGMSAAVSGFLGVGIKTAAEFETMEVALRTITGDSDKAAEAMETIKQVAKDSPFFETSTLARFTQIMAGSGQTIDDAVGSAIRFGDVAAAFGKGNEEMGRMGNTLSQVIGKGRADVIDFRELVNAGWTSVRKDVAETMEITMAEFETMVSNGEIGYDQIAQAAGRFSGSAEAQSGTFSAITQRMKESFTTLAAGIVEDSGIFDIVKGALDGIVTALDSLDSEEIVRFLSSMAQYAPIIVGAVLGGLVPAFLAWGAAMIPVVAGLVASAIALLPFIAIGAAIGAAIFLLYQAWETNFLGIQDIVKGVVDWFANTAWPNIKKVFDFIGAVLTTLGQIFTNIFNLVIKPLLESFIGYFENVFWKPLKSLFDIVTLALEDMGLSWSNVWEGIKTVVKTVLDFVVDFVKSKVNAVIGFINGIIDAANTIGSVNPEYTKINKVPMLADGAMNFTGGLALVGEQGPELVNLPGGSDVYSNSDTGRMLGGGVNIYINEMNVKDRGDINRIGEEIGFRVGIDPRVFSG